MPERRVELFRGGDLSAWCHEDGRPAEWKCEDNYFEVVPGRGDVYTRETFGDYHLHIEFWLPSLPLVKGQDRANSGVLLSGIFEIQILDSFEHDTYFAGSCGSLYGLVPPAANASLPPEQWQAYDIDFKRPRQSDTGDILENGVVSVLHNGIQIHDSVAIDRPTTGIVAERLDRPAPLRLQDHGNRVRFRNIVLVSTEP